MSDDTTRGSVELAVIGFPGSRFNGEVAIELNKLEESGTVHILDLVIVTKGTDGTVTGIELSDLDDEARAPFDDIDGEVNGLLSDGDLEVAGELLEPGDTAALIVWENTWARSLVGAIRASGGSLLAHDRLDAETVAAALAESGE
jgi:hypothetical protein